MSKQVKPKKQTKAKGPAEDFLHRKRSAGRPSGGFLAKFSSSEALSELWSRTGDTKLSALLNAWIRGEHSDATVYAGVLSHAVDTFGSRTNANAWLNRPNRLFANKTPLQILTEDPEAVEEELVRIDHGMFV